MFENIAADAKPKIHVSEEPRRQRSYVKHIVGVVAAIAATVLFLFVILPGGNQIASVDPENTGVDSQLKNLGSRFSDVNWGFAESGLLEASISEDQMLQKLSEASVAWFNKIPESAKQLEERLRQFDLGCKELLAADLPQLSKANRNAVHAACEDCRAAIASQLAELDAGTDFDVALLNADSAINQLSDAIQGLG